MDRIKIASDLPRDIGVFIRDLRRNARISLRQLAATFGLLQTADQPEVRYMRAGTLNEPVGSNM